MNIKLIDQGLNIAITGLIYGTEAWFLCSFGLYVATRRAKAALAESPLSKSPATPRAIEISESVEIPKKTELGTLEISTVHAVPSRVSVVEANFAESDEEERKQVLEAIACEPVNWKKWKVSDLRAANIAKECGVKTQPIGSRRNLTKADLIAQYEQNLRRLTKAPPKQADREEEKAKRSKIA